MHCQSLLIELVSLANILFTTLFILQDCHDIGFIFWLFPLVIIKCPPRLPPSCKFLNDASVKTYISRFLPKL